MNRHVPNRDGETALLAEIVMRSEMLRRNKLWMVSFTHGALLLVTFLVLVTLADSVVEIWPVLAAINQDPWLNLARLGLLAMAAWILVSSSRRNAEMTEMEVDLLRAEIRELQQHRTAHS